MLISSMKEDIFFFLMKLAGRLCVRQIVTEPIICHSYPPECSHEDINRKRSHFICKRKEKTTLPHPALQSSDSHSWSSEARVRWVTEKVWMEREERRGTAKESDSKRSTANEKLPVSRPVKPLSLHPRQEMSAFCAELTQGPTGSSLRLQLNLSCFLLQRSPWARDTDPRGLLYWDLKLESQGSTGSNCSVLPLVTFTSIAEMP